MNSRLCGSDCVGVASKQPPIKRDQRGAAWGSAVSLLDEPSPHLRAEIRILLSFECRTRADRRIVAMRVAQSIAGVPYAIPRFHYHKEKTRRVAAPHDVDSCGRNAAIPQSI